MRASSSILLALPILLAGCAELGLFQRADRPEPTPTQRPDVTPASAPATGRAGTTVVAPPRAVTSTVGALDTVSEAEKAEARNAAATTATAALGTETVSLGNPGDPGLWVKTGLVTAERSGTVTAPDGTSVAVALRPLAGAGGAQISLSALQALGLPLAGLHSVTLSSS